MPQDFLGTTNDDWMQVRTSDLRLLGCVPKAADGFEHIVGASTRAYPIGIVGMPCVLVEDTATFDPKDIPGFIPYAKAPTAKQLQAEAAIAPNDPDIAKAV